MKKRVGTFLMALVLLVTPLLTTISTAMAATADGALVLKLHYHRPDGAYDGWDVWFWEVGGEGGGIPFAEEDGEMVATKEVTPGITSVGFIVRQPDWTKDVDLQQRRIKRIFWI